ncbi:hypothetical protein NBEOAGPD_2399 [Methylobacterium gregans]|uniref:Uncharacterized protein n=1 Tax=Methylobacterium gregans TaxID=374424 RepID=A0AA37HNZ1_9HYPH|nr:hypothetical protein NBEOAGPD_2399 [Methylobacterium gregans]
MSKFQLIVAKWDPSNGAWARLKSADLDTLITLEDAAWAPEVTDTHGFAIFSVAQLRAATKARGPKRLRSMRPGHGLLVTRRELKEWRERCLDLGSPPASSSTSTVGSGPSTTGSSSDAQRTALAIAQRLKRSSRSTSSSGTAG